MNYQNKYQFQAQLTFLLVFSVLDIEKVFDVEEFLDQFDISNSNLTVKSDEYEVAFKGKGLKANEAMPMEDESEPVLDAFQRLKRILDVQIAERYLC